MKNIILKYKVYIAFGAIFLGFKWLLWTVQRPFMHIPEFIIFPLIGIIIGAGLGLLLGFIAEYLRDLWRLNTNKNPQLPH